MGLRGGSGLAAAIKRASSKIAGNVGLIIGGNVSFGKGGGGGGSGGGSGGGGGGSRVAVGRGFSANGGCSLTDSEGGCSLREGGSLTEGVSLAGGVSLTGAMSLTRSCLTTGFCSLAGGDSGRTGGLVCRFGGLLARSRESRISSRSASPFRRYTFRSTTASGVIRSIGL